MRWSVLRRMAFISFLAFYSISAFAVLPFQSTQGNSSNRKTPITKKSKVDTKPRLLNHPRPSYTESARRKKIEGMVYLKLLVGTDGKVKQVQVVKDLPEGLTYEAVVAAFEQRYLPATKNGQSVEYWLNKVAIEFNLRR